VDHFDTRFFFHDYVSVFVFDNFVVFHENIGLRVEIEPCTFVLVDFVIDDFYFLGVGYLDT